MEERKVKITIDNGDDCCQEITGRAVIGFTFDTQKTADGNTDAAFFVGRGDPQVLLVKAAIQLGELTRKMTMDDGNDILLATAVVMATKLLEAAAGKNDEYETVSTFFKKEEVRNESNNRAEQH